MYFTSILQLKAVTIMPNKAFQPTVPPTLRYGSTSAELGR